VTITNQKVSNQKSHESAVGHISGKAVYTDDQRLPAGMLSLYPVLSPHARAKITKLDCTAAYEVTGLVTILTADDISGENNTGVIIHDEVMLPTDEVSYWGQVVVWAVGETEEAARQAAAKVIVEYEPLPAILSIQEAIAADIAILNELWKNREEEIKEKTWKN
jgi:xanthine dehydrogenase large subunit